MAGRVVHSFFADGRQYAAADGGRRRQVATASQQMRHIQR